MCKKFFCKLFGCNPVVPPVPPPDPLVYVKLCSESNLSATEWCPDPVWKWVKTSQLPDRPCDIHTGPAV
jgi:hypothetical protein